MACRCGDTVTADYALADDLGPCPGNGLVVKSSVRLDCRGHRITGPGNLSEKAGIFLDGRPGAEIRGATVKGCRVSGFQRGIRLRAASSNLIAGNAAIGNGNRETHRGYGIDVSAASHNNIFEGNQVEGNADEGIHVGTGSHKNRFVENVSRDNHREALYLLAADGNVFLRNTLGGGVNSLYLKDSSGNLFEGNTFVGRTARIIGASRDNQFVDNSFSGAGLHFAPYKGNPARAPSNNRVTGGEITKAQDCLRFTSSRGNVVTDTTFADCRTAVRGESPAGPSENSVIGPPPASVALDGGSTLELGRRVRIQVSDAAGAPVAGAQVQAVDVTGRTQFSAATDDMGVTPPQIVIMATRTGSESIARTPLHFTVTKPGYATGDRTVTAVDEPRLLISLRPQ